MPANLSTPFSESCCDGGESPNANSARSCGCDPGEGWVCQVHQQYTTTTLTPVEVTLNLPKSLGMVYANPLDRHLVEVVDRTWNANSRCETPKDHDLNAAIGLAAEAGEVLDIHKKMYFHKDKNYMPDLIKELGDVCYYLAKELQVHGLSLEAVLEVNRVKLFERYDIHE